MTAERHPLPRHPLPRLSLPRLVGTALMLLNLGLHMPEPQPVAIDTAPAPLARR
ncbi:hypothetical protein HKCCE2091_14125 [Rhodobacterales bacterium HKCCE2091]|nr:hypothetical protein [Rhodobacterales bacterium HKCCE2091]